MASVGKTSFVVVLRVEAVVFIVVGSILTVIVVDVVVVVMVEGFSLVAEARFGSLYISLNNTNPHIPRPRSVQRMRITKLGLNLHLPCFRVDTCFPSLSMLVG